MSSMITNVRDKLKRRFSHKDPDVNFDDEDAEYDEETSNYVTKETEDAEKDEKYPMGRPNSFLNRMISHGNKKTEDEIARDAAAAQQSNRAKTDAISAGQTMGAGQTTATQMRQQ